MYFIMILFVKQKNVQRQNIKAEVVGMLVLSIPFLWYWWSDWNIVCYIKKYYASSMSQKKKYVS